MKAVLDKRLLLLGFAALLAALLAFALTRPVRVLLLTPVFYILWVAWTYVMAAPRVVWWGLLILTLLLLARYSLAGARLFMARQPTDPKKPAPSRVQAWAQMIHMSGRGPYSRWQFERKLAELALEQLTHRHHIEPDTAVRVLSEGRFNLPPNVQEFILTVYTKKSYEQFRDATQARPAHARHLEVIAFLEGDLQERALQQKEESLEH
jgi:hypothetical protein